MAPLPLREGPEPRVPVYRGTPGFAAGMAFAAFLIRFAGSDQIPGSRKQRDAIAEYLEDSAFFEWRR
jgi:hypothetical protein